MQGRTEDALEILERGHALENENNVVHEGLVVAMGGDDHEALLTWLDRAIRVEESLPGERVILEAMAERLDDRDAALDWLRDAYGAGVEAEYWIAIWAAYFDEPELALAALRRRVDGWPYWLPVMENVRATPEFRDYVRDSGLVSFWQEFGWGDFCRPTGDEGFDCR